MEHVNRVRFFCNVDFFFNGPLNNVSSIWKFSDIAFISIFPFVKKILANNLQKCKI